ncbi:MAG: hypothetical protein AAFZ07_25685 [Actinomycetota bacterium]
MPGPLEARFDGYAGPPPDEPWEFGLDDHRIIYRDGHWPFARREDARHRRNAREPRGVRLAPDCRFHSWRNWYVLVFPARTEWVESTRVDGRRTVRSVDGPAATAILHLWDRPQGMGGYVWNVKARLDFTAGTFQIHRGGELPGHVLDLGEDMCRKLLRFLEAERTRRDTNPRPWRPITAHERASKETAR